ncbi:MAG: efflux RND transporter periplasmic adaptor subunit [Rhodospirillaceae bacterium]|nr:efflux RND transporter periplasmic adaptor subunit [Rhodospirillaceae bacterium]
MHPASLKTISGQFTNAIMLALVLGVLGFSFEALAQKKKQGDDRPAIVSIDLVKKEIARQSVPVIGRLIAAQSGVVSALIKGPVEKITARVGDRVMAGDVLARLQSNSLKWERELRAAEVEGAQARLKSATTQTELRRQVLKRFEDLKTSAAFSPARFEDARLELAKAESATAEARSQLRRARASLALADIGVANASVKAPYSGVITKIHTEAGTYVSLGQPVVSMISETGMEIEASVPANRTAGLTTNTRVPYRIGTDFKGEAMVRAVVPDENPLTRTRAVRFTPTDASQLGAVAANQSVHLDIPAGPAREVVSVHKDAVLNKAGRQVVFIVENDAATLRPVTLGEAVGQRFVVLNGLKPGDQVVVRGNERLREGQSVRVKEKAQ